MKLSQLLRNPAGLGLYTKVDARFCAAPPQGKAQRMTLRDQLSDGEIDRPTERAAMHPGSKHHGTTSTAIPPTPNLSCQPPARTRFGLDLTKLKGPANWSYFPLYGIRVVRGSPFDQRCSRHHALRLVQAKVELLHGVHTESVCTWLACTWDARFCRVSLAI